MGLSHVQQDKAVPSPMSMMQQLHNNVTPESLGEKRLSNMLQATRDRTDLA